MAQRKVISEHLEALNSLKSLAESFEQIAVVRMQKIKDSVLKTRSFLEELSDVYVDLKTSYEREIKELLRKRKENEKSLLKALHKSGGTLLVYLSANGKLYGAVTQKTYKLFAQDIKKPEYASADILIVGRAGREMYEGGGEKRPFDFFEIPDTDIDVTHVKELMEKFLKYEKVYIYYGKFGNVVTQTSIASSITGEDIFETEVPQTVPREDRFIFEPTLEKIFSFFETQIMANLFTQTLLENQLARHASRVNAMEAALVEIDKESKVFDRMKNRLKTQLKNKKQLETISGLALWEG